MPAQLAPAAFARPLYAVGLASGLMARAIHQYAEYKPAGYRADDIERNVRHVLEICDRWQLALETLAPGETFAGKRVLELGPGHSLGTGMVLLARGATSYTAVDVFPLAHRSPADLYSALAAAEACSPDLAKRARFQIVSFPTLDPLDGCFDLIVSNSTLEHVEDVPATFRALRKRTTGLMVHHVDASVHLRIRKFDPLNHLRYSDRVYRWMYYKGVPNRLLYRDYEVAAHEAGFSDTRVRPKSIASADYVATARRQFAPPFRKRDDLHLLSFTFLAR
jgi:methyltransferase family protein